MKAIRTSSLIQDMILQGKVRGRGERERERESKKLLPCDIEDGDEGSLLCKLPFTFNHFG